MDIVLDAGSVATAIIALVGFGVATYRWVVKPMRALLVHVHEVIVYELKPNGGKSLHDRIAVIENKLDAHMSDSAQHFAEQHNRRRRYDPDYTEAPGDRN